MPINYEKEIKSLIEKAKAPGVNAGDRRAHLEQALNTANEALRYFDKIPQSKSFYQRFKGEIALLFKEYCNDPSFLREGLASIEHSITFARQNPRLHKLCIILFETKARILLAIDDRSSLEEAYAVTNSVYFDPAQSAGLSVANHLRMRIKIETYFKLGKLSKDVGLLYRARDLADAELFSCRRLRDPGLSQAAILEMLAEIYLVLDQLGEHQVVSDAHSAVNEALRMRAEDPYASYLYVFTLKIKICLAQKVTCSAEDLRWVLQRMDEAITYFSDRNNRQSLWMFYGFKAELLCHYVKVGFHLETAETHRFLEEAQALVERGKNLVPPEDKPSLLYFCSIAMRASELQQKLGGDLAIQRGLAAANAYEEIARQSEAHDKLAVVYEARARFYAQAIKAGAIDRSLLLSLAIENIQHALVCHRQNGAPEEGVTVAHALRILFQLYLLGNDFEQAENIAFRILSIAKRLPRDLNVTVDYRHIAKLNRQRYLASDDSETRQQCKERAIDFGWRALEARGTFGQRRNSFSQLYTIFLCTGEQASAEALVDRAETEQMNLRPVFQRLWHQYSVVPRPDKRGSVDDAGASSSRRVRIA